MLDIACLILYNFQKPFKKSEKKAGFFSRPEKFIFLPCGDSGNPGVEPGFP